MQTQLEERRGLDRRIKDLEIRLSGALSSKSLGDEEHARRVKVSYLCDAAWCQRLHMPSRCLWVLELPEGGYTGEPVPKMGLPKWELSSLASKC